MIYDNGTLATFVLVDAYSIPGAPQFLYDMLVLRPTVASISHKEMPSYKDHCKFFNSKPYAAWYLIYLQTESIKLGNIYLTKHNEIGVFILPSYQRHGIAKWAIRDVMARHGAGRYLANIAPANQKSTDLFLSLDFEHIQNTYALDIK